MIRVAINGFGRIGRHVLRAGLKEKKIEFVAVNDITDANTLAYLLKHDSVFGAFEGSVEAKNNNLYINKKKVIVLNEKDPSRLPWKKLKIDVVVESTGLLTSRDSASIHLVTGSRKVLVSAPCKNADITLVKGVNEREYNAKKHHVISNASCTTNALAPLMKSLNQAFGIQQGFMITAHALTADQRLIDSPHKDLRRGRSAVLSIIPTTTGAAKSVEEVLPALKGKLDGLSWRVPLADGSIVNLSCVVKKNVSAKLINNTLRNASKNALRGILEVSDEALVSQDIIGNSHSSIVDAASTRVVKNHFISVSVWYDNEWAYACRTVDIIKIL